MNALGKRMDGGVRDELIVRVYADDTPRQFTLYEDDGVTSSYQRGAVRSTVISQQRAGTKVTVVIEPPSGTYDGAPASRNNVVQIVARDATAVDVSVNGSCLAQQPSEAAFEAADRGWYVDGSVIAVKPGVLDVLQRRVFEVSLAAVSQVVAPSELCSSARLAAPTSGWAMREPR
jgi:hypothetical protein